MIQYILLNEPKDNSQNNDDEAKVIFLVHALLLPFQLIALIGLRIYSNKFFCCYTGEQVFQLPIAFCFFLRKRKAEYATMHAALVND